MWLGVDPLWEKYAGMNPYNYCAGNPVMLVDRDGREPVVVSAALLIIGSKLLGKSIQQFGRTRDTKTLGFALDHPYVAFRTGDCINGYETLPWISTYAGNFQANLQNAGVLKKMTSSNDLEGSEGNAFRHVLWQAMLTSEFNESIATQIGNVHEDNAMVSLNNRVFKSISEADQTIDLLNNEIGRTIGKRNSGCSNNTIAKEVLEEFKDSGLFVAEKLKDGTFYVRKRCISEEKYNEGIKLIEKKGENGLNK